MPMLKIENMQLYHLDNIMEIESKCYGEHHWARDSFVNEINNSISQYLCAIDDENRCLGYLGMWKIIDEAHVTNLAVHPDFQRQGVAHFLIVNSIERCYQEKIKYIKKCNSNSYINISLNTILYINNNSFKANDRSII